jgi:predicted nuclease with TOPRIM domain
VTVARSGEGRDSGRVADDSDIQQRIKALIDEEHHLRDRLSQGEISVEEENQRLRGIEVELDQCWDLLRQRRARREFGENPAGAEVRDATVVENYTG